MSSAQPPPTDDAANLVFFLAQSLQQQQESSSNNRVREHDLPTPSSSSQQPLRTTSSSSPPSSLSQHANGDDSDGPKGKGGRADPSSSRGFWTEVSFSSLFFFVINPIFSSMNLSFLHFLFTIMFLCMRGESESERKKKKQRSCTILSFSNKQLRLLRSLIHFPFFPSISPISWLLITTCNHCYLGVFVFFLFVVAWCFAHAWRLKWRFEFPICVSYL